VAISTTDADGLTTVLGDGPPELPVVPPGTTLGRYVVIEVVGRGGAGTVLRAYDPRLHREVAIKRLRADSDMPENAERFVREARAMARLSHPNVVAVFDVEEHDGEVIIAMEYVAGSTLRDHVRDAASPLPWRRVVGLYAQAGRGLLAAHQSGLVHRDFKPTNVLVSERGRVKVGDFGLAKTSADATADPVPSSDFSSDGDFDDGLSELTQQHTVLGTPRYMAPEQHARDRLTAKTDQYAFCLALWEALVGKSPFPDEELMRNKLAGAPSWPVEVSVPQPIVEAIARGLSPSPKNRWPSMAELLEALEFEPNVQRRRRWVLGATGAVVGLGVGAWQIEMEARRRRCSEQAESIRDEWNGDVRGRVEQAFAQSGAGAAKETAANTIVWIDRFADEWTKSTEESCLAHELEGSLTEVQAERRHACLGTQRDELAGFLSLLQSLDATHLAPLAEAAVELGPPQRCEDDALLARLPAPPENAERRSEYEALRAEVFRARLLGEIDQIDACLELLAELEPRLAEPGLQMLRATALRAEGHALWTEMRSHDAVAVFQEALEQALAIDDELNAARSATDLGRILSAELGQHDEAGRWLAVARSLAGTHGGDPLLHVELLLSETARLRLAGHFEEARAAGVEALAAATSTHGPEHPVVADALNQLAIVEGDLGDGEQAIAHLERARDVWRRAYGENSEAVAMAYANLGVAYNKMGRKDEALAYLERGVEVARRVWRSTHPETALKLSNAATLAMQMGRLELAKAYSEQAVDAMRAELGLNDPNTSHVLTTMGRIYDRLGDTVGARKALEDALKAEQLDTLSRVRTEISLSASYLDDNDQLALEYAQAAWDRMSREGLEVPAARSGALTALSRANRRIGEYERALEQAIRAYEYDVESRGAESRAAGVAQTDIVRCLTKLERWQEALDRIETMRSSPLWDVVGPVSRAQLEVVTGDCHRGLGEAEQARTAYQRASELYETTGDTERAAGVRRRIDAL